MKRKRVVLLILLICGIGLWISQDRWLTFLSNQLAVVEKYSGLLEGVDALLNIVLLIFNASLSYFLWLSRDSDTSEGTPPPRVPAFQQSFAAEGANSEPEYSRGLAALRELINDQETQLALANQESRLHSCLQQEQELGSTDETRRTKSETLQLLNQISFRHTGRSFYQLCDASNFAAIPVDRLLRSAVPNLGSTRELGREWLKRRLQEVLAGLLWIDRDCGFEVEDYVGLTLVVKSARFPSSYTVTKVSSLESILGVEEVRMQSKDARMEEYRSTDIFDIFSRLSEPMVLLGDPGSGKSVSLRHLGQTIVERQLKKADENDFVIPVYIHLGDYIHLDINGEPLPFQEFILDYTSRVWNQSKEQVREKFVELAESGRLVFLFDSMDEMPRDDYIKRYDEMRAFMRRFGLNRFVFACRPADYDDRLRVSEVVLAPLSKRQIEEYLELFLTRSFGWSRQQVKYVVEQIEEDNPTLLSFLSNPFYLKLAGLYIGTSDGIPTTFASLFAQLIETTWNHGAEEHAPSELDESSFNQFTEILALTGYCMTVNGGVGTAIELPDLLETVSLLQGGDPSPELIQSNLTVAKQLKLVQIREFGRSTVSFQHHKIQEYFTALHLLGRESELNDLLPRAGILGGIWWQETIVLLAAISEHPAPIFDYLFGIDAAAIGRTNVNLELDIDSLIQVLEGERVEMLARCYSVSRDRLSSGVLFRIINEIGATMSISDPIRRASYARALSRLNHPEADKLLHKRLDDQSGWVRHEAFAALLDSKSTSRPNRTFVYKYLWESILQGKAWSRGRTVAGTLIQRRQLLDVVPVAGAASAVGLTIGFLTAIVLIFAYIFLTVSGIPQYISILALVPFAYVAYMNARLFRVITFQKQLRQILIIVAYSILVFFLVTQFETIWIIPIALIMVNFLNLLLTRLVGGEEALQKLIDSHVFQREAHTKLHEELSVLGEKFAREGHVLSVRMLDALVDLYTRGCTHVHQGIVDLLREGTVDAVSYGRLRNWAKNQSYSDPYFDDIWRIVHEKELQLRRQAASRRQHLVLTEQLITEKMADPGQITFAQVVSTVEGPLGVSQLVQIADRFSHARNFQQAELALRKALEFSANDPSLIVRLGNCMVSAGRYEDARKVFLDGSRKHSTDASLAFGIAAASSWLEDYDQAYQWVERACELAPSNGHYRNFSAYLEFRKQYGAVRLRATTGPRQGQVLKPTQDAIPITVPLLTPGGVKPIEVARVAYRAPYFVIITKNLLEVFHNGAEISGQSQLDIGDYVAVNDTEFLFTKKDLL